jgi:hypothetical protein
LGGATWGWVSAVSAAFSRALAWAFRRFRFSRSAAARRAARSSGVFGGCGGLFMPAEMAGGGGRCKGAREGCAPAALRLDSGPPKAGAAVAQW